MKSNGFKNKEIIKVFENEPFVDIQKLITYFKILEERLVVLVCWRFWFARSPSNPCRY